MPANKSQHFVPRCYLRAFCADDEGAAINVFNIGRELSIKGAPAKGQCARPYFYGRDGVLERALQEPEGAYGEIMRRAMDDPRVLSLDHLSTLHAFMVLQSYRSAAWIEGMIRLAEAQRALVAEEATPELLESIVVTHENAIMLAVGAFRQSLDTTRHLETRLIMNRTIVPFFTSDDPVVYTNRFHLQKDVLGGVGLSSPGGLLLMPLSPRTLLLSYDPVIYRLVGQEGELGIIDRAADAAAVNDLQAVWGRSNLYFREWQDLVETAHQVAKPRRREDWFEVENLQETAPCSGVFAPKGDAAYEPGRKEMLHTARNVPAPADWPSILSYTLHARRARRGVDQSSLWG